jgi:hypothetical protein
LARKDRDPLTDTSNQQFDAHLPRLAKAVRIEGLADARIFARRWVIRDKDPALKAVLRLLERAESAETSACALRELKSALASRGLLPGTRHLT